MDQHLAHLALSIAGDLSVEALPMQSAMSPRNFARRFVAEFGVPPARFVAEVRAETALRMQHNSDMSREAIADECGFRSLDAMERAVAGYRRRGPKQAAPG